MADISIKKYQPADHKVWNEFVRKSKNGVFIFEREFMEYHAHRFKDHSVMIFEGGSLKSVMAANEENGSIISHGGLSYGGLLLEEEAHLADVLTLFYHVLKYFSDNGFPGLTYKCAPSYLARVPSFEDLYALFLVNATLVRRDMSAVCSPGHALSFRDTRRQTVRKAAGRGVKVVLAQDPSQFWEILESNLLERHGVRPVHTLDEIRLLMKCFPEQIHCYEAIGEKLVGGTVIFETTTTAHAQYIASTPDGKSTGALDLLFHVLITETFAHKPYFSFGMSNEKDGRHLNLGLNSWKEGFGATAFPLDFYRVQTSNHTLLGPYA